MKPLKSTRDIKLTQEQEIAKLKAKIERLGCFCKKLIKKICGGCGYTFCACCGCDKHDCDSTCSGNRCDEIIELQQKLEGIK